MDEKTDARDQQVVELVEESAKSVLGEPDEEVGGAMKKPDDVSVAFGGARPKIKPRNTLDYGGGVMEKTKPKKKRRNKDRKHHERQFSDKEMMEMMENLPAVPTDIDIRSSSDNLDSARDGLPSRARFASDATPKTRTEEDSIISELGGVADLTDSVVLNIPEDSLINERGAVANLPEPIISEDDSSINKLGPVANLLEPVEVIVPENPLPPFVPDDNDEWEEPDYGNRPFRTFAINGRYRAGESLALERDNHWNNRECCILGMWIAVGVSLFGLLVILLTRKQMEDLENAAEEYKNATEEYKNATKEYKDYEEQLDRRREINAGMKRAILQDLQQLLHEHHALVRLFKSALERMSNDDYKVVIKADKRPSGTHERTFNAPTIDKLPS
ncbi:uncharacterized protein TNIN_474551 [Trichonephila inaurata madagascariensis]|uniref:Uncharacterized protein n=1 Tax=Trichonephila inaurata madagascariensis TaxID=2747483 RepID=A0A8X7C4F3_9ARAC|nr:uncharacterized protein TNIN_474551 [Trichonephila inaurata madagascariensis]